jgi:ribosomal protein L11 methyltransferase
VSPGVHGADGWHAVRVRPGADADAVVAALFAAGSLGVQEDGDSFLTHFPPETDLAGLRDRITALDPAADVQVRPADPTDWARAWQDRVGAHPLGALIVAPPWLAGQFEAGRTIVIDPGMAFGTGEHPTTRGVIRLLQRVLRPGDVVADLGAGSAVLAIAAAKLGASRVAAIEIDADAIGNAEENVVRNGVADRVQVIEGDAALLLPLIAPVRVVLANIISSVLVELLPAIERALAPDGQAVLSGILYTESEDMLDVLGAGGWRIDAEDREEIWWSVSISRP